jgi:polyhydroxybutyrate depolymerase
MRNTLSASIIFSLTVLIAGPVWAEQRKLMTPDGERDYLIVTPQTVEGTTLLSVVIAAHGGLGNGPNFAKVTGLAEKVVSRGGIGVFPNGTGVIKNHYTWNAAENECCGEGMKNHIKDVSFIDHLIDEVIAKYQANPNCIFVTGESNGAILTHRLGIELSDKIAAIAPVAGGLFGDEAKPANPVSAIIINGAQDENVPPGGGPPGGPFADQWGGTPLKPAAFQGTFWAAADGCDPVPEVTQTANGAVTMEQFKCPPGYDVVSVVHGGGHGWPGGQKDSPISDEPSTSLDATEVILDFFWNHCK